MIKELLLKYYFNNALSELFLDKPTHSQYLRKEITRREKTLSRKNGTYHFCKVSAPSF